jgi:hypothetical protein
MNKKRAIPLQRELQQHTTARSPAPPQGNRTARGFHWNALTNPLEAALGDIHGHTGHAERAEHFGREVPNAGFKDRQPSVQFGNIHIVVNMPTGLPGIDRK